MRIAGIILLLFCCCKSFGQKSLYGKIAGADTKQAMAFASITIVNAAGKPYTITVADTAGRYMAPMPVAGAYILQCVLVGYDTARIAFTVLPGRDTLLMPTVYLVRTNVQLQHVTVSVRRAVIERQADGLVYNINENDQAAGNNALEVLRKVPMVMVTAEGAISIIGKATVKILIDDKPAELYGANPGDFLAQLPADKIDRIKVITNPSAKYDAEGAASVLLIYTKKHFLQNFTGSARVEVRNRFNNVYGVGMFYKKRRLSLSLNTSYNTFLRFNIKNITRTTFTQPASQLYETINDTTKSMGYSTSLNTDWEIDSLNAVSINVTVNGSTHHEQEGQQINMLYSNSKQQYSRMAYGGDRNIYPVYSLAYSKHFKKQGRELSFLSYYNTRYFRDEYSLNQFADEGNYTDRYKTVTHNNELSMQADYVNPVTKTIKWEAGAKAATRMAGSVFTRTPYDGLRSGVFDYRQRIAAAYFNIEFPLKRWKLRTGIRYEQTSITATFSSKQVYVAPYKNVVPNLLLSKNYNNNNILSLSYTQNIYRPYISYLNPVVDYSDSLNLSSGNPALKPAVIHTVEAAFTLSLQKNNFLRLAVYGTSSNNLITQIRRIQANNVMLNTWQNVGVDHSTGISASLNQAITKKLKAVLNVNAYWQQRKVPEMQLTNKGIRLYQTLYLTYNATSTFFMEGFIMFQTRAIDLQGFTYYATPQYYVMSATKKLSNNRFSINFTINNPFSPRQAYVQEFADKDFKQKTREFNSYRTFFLRFNWRFNGKLSETHSSAGNKSQQVE